jgi:hypothetical protein
MALIRVKYRPAAVQPEGTVAKYNSSLSVAKKVKPVPVDPYADLPKVSNDPTIFLASHTQIRRIEVVVTSNEEEYRVAHYPTIEERVKKQKEWAIIQAREAKMASEREALRQNHEKAALRARQLLTAIQLHKKDGTPIPPALQDPLSDLVDPQIPPDPLGPDGLPLSVNMEEEEDEDHLMSADFAAELLDIKEKKILVLRDCSSFHKHLSKWDLRKITLRYQFDLLPTQEKDYSVILPWLVVGKKDVALNELLLTKLNITHILNMTSHIPNKFPQSFIYKKVPVRDSDEEDISVHWPAIINFIARAEKVKGRVRLRDL